LEQAQESSTWQPIYMVVKWTYWLTWSSWLVLYYRAVHIFHLKRKLNDLETT
jgi:hypothetical protein